MSEETRSWHTVDDFFARVLSQNNLPFQNKKLKTMYLLYTVFNSLTIQIYLLVIVSGYKSWFISR